MYNVYAYAYACACYFFVKFYILGRNHQQNEDLPKNTPSTCLGRRSILWLAGTSNTAWKIFDEDMGGPGGTMGGRLMEMSGMATECNAASSKMDGREPTINHKLAHAWLQNLVRSHSLSVLIKAVPFEQSKNKKWSLLSWASCLANSQLISASLLAARPTINPTPLPESRLSSGTQNQILSLTFGLLTPGYPEYCIHLPVFRGGQKNSKQAATLFNHDDSIPIRGLYIYIYTLTFKTLEICRVCQNTSCFNTLGL